MDPLQTGGRARRPSPRTARRTKGDRRANAQAGAQAFRTFLPSTPEPAHPSGTSRARGVEVMTVASSREGTHIATLRVESASGDDLVMSVLLDRGLARVRIEVPDAAAAAWVSERTDRIREAVERAGLRMTDLELRRQRGSGGSGGRSRERRRGRG